jgi:hypothetical protein
MINPPLTPLHITLLGCVQSAHDSGKPMRVRTGASDMDALYLDDLICDGKIVAKDAGDGWSTLHPLPN